MTVPVHRPPIGRAFWPCALLVVLVSGCLQAPAGAPASDAAPLGDARAAVCQDQVRGLDLQKSTIQELQEALAQGRVTSVALVEAYLARIDAFDHDGPKLNSIQVTHPQALELAAALDAERKAGNVRSPLHGIPILLKDNVGTMDLATTAGSIALEKNVPPRDATITQRLRDAGAIILGKAQLSEFANWVSLNMPSGYSSLGGQVTNAYTGGNPSGSSSGSGVAASMAFAGATIGTETSGSILSPSNANSVVGLKPTLGLVSRAGIIPLAENFDVPGPMVRNVHDAALVLSAIAGTDARDPATAEGDRHLPPDGDYAAALGPDALRGVRLGVQSSNSPVFQQALKDLEALGAVLVPLESKTTTQVSILEIPLIFNEFHYGINAYLAQEAGPGLPVSDLTGIILFNQQHPDQVKYGQDLLLLSDANAGNGIQAEVAAIPVVAASRAAADGLFEEHRVEAIVGLGAPFTSLGAAAGYPTVTLPAGYNGKSPQGLSFFGPAWSEAQLLSYAYAYEQATHRRVPPTVVNADLLSGVCA